MTRCSSCRAAGLWGTVCGGGVRKAHSSLKLAVPEPSGSDPSMPAQGQAMTVAF